MSVKNPDLWRKVGKVLVYVARTVLFLKKKKDEKNPKQ